MSVSWLACRAPRADPRARVVCFPHSGASAGEYLRLADEASSTEIHAVQLPGRGARTAEEPFRRMPELVDAIVEGATFPPDAAFFGHSLGAVVAFEVARALRDRGRPPPRCLFVSALPAPHLALFDAPVTGLDDDGLLDALSGAYGPLADEIRDDLDLRDLVLPGLRADLEIVESYVHETKAPLEVPVVALGGDADAIAREELEAWRRHTTSSFELHLFAGDHFYFRRDPRALVEVLEQTLSRLP